MTLEKAIKINTLLSTNLKGVLGNAGVEATKLGMEALKHIKRGRECRGNYVDNLLPGETKELLRLPKMIIAGPRVGRKGDQN